jgi:DNA-binding MarR family transcriptional regulator
MPVDNRSRLSAVPSEELPTGPVAHELRETLGRLVRRLRAEEPGPHVGRLVVLGHLDRQGPASISDLAAIERMRPQSMAQTVTELEASGFVSRRPDPADGRRAFIELTAAGREALMETRNRRESWLTDALARELNAAELAELRSAIGLLARVVDS